MALLPYAYAWAVGHNVPLGSLTSIEDYLYPYTRPRRIVPATQPVDAFPVRTILGSGRERGDGMITHIWTFSALPQTAVQQIINDVFTSGTVVSRAVTINTRQHELGGYGRYNAYAALPKPGQEITYLRQGIFTLQIRFTHLIPAS